MDYMFFAAVIICSLILIAGVKAGIWLHQYFHRKLLKIIESKEEKIYLDFEKLDIYELRVLPNWESSPAKMYTYQIVVNGAVVYMTMFDTYYVGVLIDYDGNNCQPLRWYESMFETGGFKHNDKLAVTFHILKLCKIIRSNGKESGNVS